jgi:hypothetical protein
MLKKSLLVIVLVVAGFLGYAATRPAGYHVERSAKIEAGAPVVFNQINDFKNWAAWSPWEKLDPKMSKSYDGAPRGVGAKYAWQGNKKVGKGKMEITESQVPTLVALRLEFLEPFAAVADTRFQLAPEGDKATTVTWSMDGKNNFIGKVFSVVMNMDKSVGGDFDRGLANLAQVSVAEAKKQEEADAAAKATADAAAKARADAQQAEKPAAKGKGKAGKGGKAAKGRRKRR